MRLEHLSLQETGLFNPLLSDYLAGKEQLKRFYAFQPGSEGIAEALQTNNLPVSTREVLVQSLQKQYSGVAHGEHTKKNIASLAEANTFTVTTGHQLNIFTGPLFFIYKIVAVINACKALKKAHPDKQFVPVYWMATEDHDLDEIRSFQLFGKAYTWETDQTGPVGRMTTRGLAELAATLPEAVPAFEKAYAASENLSQATRRIVQHLFDAEGIVCLDGDDVSLKKLFVPVIKKELAERHSGALVEKASQALEQLGYKAQVFPRDINLFYMNDGLRERIVYESGGYQVLHADLAWTEEALMEEVEKHPERFSPNVVLRPVYQQLILPNAAYFGGPAEVAYWLQLKAVFAHHQAPFPVVMPRNFVLWVPKNLYKKIDQLGVQWQDLFAGYEALKEAFLNKEGFEAPDTSAQHEAVRKAYEEMVQIALDFDASLKGFIQAEESRALKSLDNIGKRLTKAAESRMDVSLRQLQQLRDKLFPNGGPQERVDNYLSIALNHPEFISVLLQHLDPFDTRYFIFSEDE
jgi:bacillithiol biosynthesis cysteine-adding enzyme BshC